MVVASPVLPGTAIRARRPSSRRRAQGFGGFFRSLPFTLPAFVLVGLFLLYPLCRAVYLSFMNYRGFGAPRFVGLSNYVQLFTSDQVFRGALTNTLVWTVASAVMPMILALPLAVVLNSGVRGRTTFRGAFYLPAVLSAIIIGMSWNFIYASDTGFLNQFLSAIGLPGLRHDWLGDPNTALYAVLVASIWAGTGTGMVLFIAGLQSVAPELVEACRIDGGNRWQVFWNVELPALRPTVSLVVLLSIIAGLKSFDLVAAMTGGGPGGSSQILAYYSWTLAITNHNYGLGSAVAVILLLLSIVFVIPYVRTALQGNSR